MHKFFKHLTNIGKAWRMTVQAHNYARQNLFHKAIPIYQEIVNKFPSDIFRHHLFNAQSIVHRREFIEMWMTFDEDEKKSHSYKCNKPVYVEELMYLGHACKDRDQFDDAIAAYKKAIKLDGSVRHEAENEINKIQNVKKSAYSY